MIYLKEGKTPLNFAYNDEIVHDGNSTYQLSFKFPTNNPLWEELVEETLLLADDLHGEQEFIIFEVEKHHAYITVHANQVATLLNNYSITELSVNNASGDRVMRSLVGSIIRDHKFTFSSDIASTHNINLKNVTVATALFKDKHSILGQWGGDLIRDKYDIRLLSNGGTNKEALFMYKKNLKSYQQKKSIKDLRTRIHFTKTISSQKEGEKDKVIAVTVDSPLISKYKNIYEGNLDVSDQDVIDEVTLRKYGEQYFKTTLCDVIEESIEIDVVGNPDVPVNIFDTVTVFHEKFNLDVKKKITKYTYTPMGRKLKTIGFGKIQQGLGTTLASMIDDAVTEHVESKVDAFKIQKNLSELLKLDRKSIEDKLVDLEEKSNSALEVKKALFEADGNIPDVVKTKILDAVEAEVGRLKTIITEAELIKAIQAKLDYAEIKNTLIDKAFINQIISDEQFTQQFEAGEVNTQNIFTKLKDSIKSNISKDFVTKEGVKKLVNDLTIDADGIRQITQQESEKVFNASINGKVQEIVGEVKKNLPTKEELKGKSSYLHKKYSDFSDGRNMSDNSTLKYIGIYTGDKQQAPTNASEYSWTKIKSDGKLYKAYSNSLNGIDFTLVEPDENAKLFAKNRPRVNIVNNNDISDIWQANMFLSFKPNTKYTLTARAKGNSNKLWAYFRNNKTNAQFNWGQLEFRGLETKSIIFTTTNDVDDVLFKFILVPEDEDWTGVQIDWFTIYEGDKRYTDYPVNEPAQYHKYRYFGYIFKESTPVASDFEWFDLQQTSITNDKYTHIVYSDNADGSNFGREPKKYMGVARTTSPTQPTDKTAYKWFKMKGEDGVSNYIHRKYSDYSNGANMSDNSNLKYIGIYTGTSSTPPTTASSYLWSKIKGEDGANGTPGAKGADGRTPYFHTAYSNSPTGDRDFSTTNSVGKEYIGTYSDFEIADSTDFRKYKWVKIKGEDGRDGDVGLNLLKGTKEFITSYFAPPDAFQRDLVWVDETERYEDFAVKSTIYQFNGLWQNVELEKDKTYEYGFYAKGSRNTNRIYFNPAWASSSAKTPLVQTSTGNIAFDLTTNWKFYSFRFTVTGTGWSQCRVEKNEYNNGIKLSICGMYLKEVKNSQQTPLKWSPSIEDLQGHSLTANLRFEGRYINSITTDVKPYLDVFYDGQKITSGFNAQVKYKGGNRTDWSWFWDANFDNNGGITNVDWGNREQNGTPLEVIVLVTYKGLNTVANARMENVPDIVEIKEITKKYKTFESTIDKFDSTIGEVKKQVLANEEKRNLIIGSRLLNASDYKVFGKVWDAESKQGIYTQIRQSTGDGVNTIYNGNSYLFAVAQNNTQYVWQGVGFNISSKLLLPGRQYSLSIPYYILDGFPPDNGIFAEIKNHNTGRVVWREELTSTSTYRNSWIEKKITFRTDRTEYLSDYSFWIYAVQNGGFCISAPYMCEGDVLPKTYSPAPEDVHLQNSRIESSIKQTKDEIDLKVSKDNVIASINASVETTGEGPAQGVVKINADKVDISGVLRAYTGEIGGFRIGYNYNDGGFWLTGKNNFDCGINPGLNAGSRGAQLWAAWGNTWTNAGPNAWWVNAQGVMTCKATPSFRKGIDVSGRYIEMNGNDIQGDKTGGGKTTVVWWSQINKANSSSSDKRLKTNIKPTKVNALDMLNNIEMVEFNWKKDGKFEKIGAIAQQVQSVEESLIVHDMDDKQTYNDYLRIKYYDTIPYLIKAVQELSEENDNLKSQLKEMNERLTKLEELINGKL